jgi:hypothetical protein
MARLVRIVLLVCVVSVIAPAGASAARSWSPPLQIGAIYPFAPTNAQAVATIPPTGEVGVVWADVDLGELRAAIRSPVPGSTPVVQDLPGAGTPLAIDSDSAGDMIAAVGVGVGIGYVVRPAGGVFGAVEVLDPDGTGEPRVAMTATGDAVIVYERIVSGGVQVMGARRPAGGSFGPPVALTPPLPVDSAAGGDATERVWLNSVALAPSGEVSVAWQRGAWRAQRIEAVRWPASGRRMRSSSSAAPGPTPRSPSTPRGMPC